MFHVQMNIDEFQVRNNFVYLFMATPGSGDILAFIPIFQHFGMFLPLFLSTFSAASTWPMKRCILVNFQCCFPAIWCTSAQRHPSASQPIQPLAPGSMQIIFTFWYPKMRKNVYYAGAHVRTQGNMMPCLEKTKGCYVGLCAESAGAQFVTWLLPRLY